MGVILNRRLSHLRLQVITALRAEGGRRLLAAASSNGSKRLGYSVMDAISKVVGKDEVSRVRSTPKPVAVHAPNWMMLFWSSPEKEESGSITNVLKVLWLCQRFESNDGRRNSFLSVG